MDAVQIPVSYGELLDKITILEIKSVAISDPQKKANIRRELAALQSIWSDRFGWKADELGALTAQLKRVNASLWDIENAIRLCDARQDFGDEFIRLARAVYKTNDERAVIKREIDVRLGSPLREEKSYATRP